MKCNLMMFGAKVRYGITYKTNERSFTIYRPKYQHNFKVPSVKKNLEGSKGVEISNSNLLLVSKLDTIYMYDN